MKLNSKQITSILYVIKTNGHCESTTCHDCPFQENKPVYTNENMRIVEDGCILEKVERVKKSKKLLLDWDKSKQKHMETILNIIKNGVCDVKDRPSDTCSNCPLTIRCLAYAGSEIVQLEELFNEDPRIKMAKDWLRANI
jgi:hypothetical protein